MGVEGKRLLLLEDDPILGMLLEDMVDMLGCRIAGSFQTVDAALEAVTAEPGSLDAAILDVNLNGSPSFPVADFLHEKGIPYIFSTGYGDNPSQTAPKLSKPFTIDELREALEKLFSADSPG